MIKKHQPLRKFPDYKSSISRSPNKEPLWINSSSSEMSGPLFNEKIINKNDNDLTLNFSKIGEKPLGQEIFVHGFVKDENGNNLKNVLIEIWQANAGGKYRHQNDPSNIKLDENFGGCGRFITSSDGYYIFKTIEPGAYPYPNRGTEWRPRHIHFSLFGSMFIQRLITQMYFEGDPLIKSCPMVNSIPDINARKLLIGRLDLSKTENEKILGYRFDIILRGKEQTFFKNIKEGL